MSFKRALKLLPKVGERTAAVLWEAVSAHRRAARRVPRAARRRRRARDGEAARPPLRARSKTSERATSRRRPRRSGYVVDDGATATYAKGKFPNHSARLDDLEALAQFALAYDDVGRFLEEVTLFGDPSRARTSRRRARRTRGSSSPPSTRPRGSSGGRSS